MKKSYFLFKRKFRTICLGAHLAVGAVLGVALASCSTGIDRLQSEGGALLYRLHDKLATIQDRESLLKSADELKVIFLAIASKLEEIEVFFDKHPSEVREGVYEPHALLVEKLREEMIRVLSLEGAEDVLEACQFESIKKLMRGRATSRNPARGV